MSDRRKIILFFIATMTTVSLAVGCLAIWALYRAAFHDKAEWLQMMVSEEARLIEAVAKFDQSHSQTDHPGGASAATLSQLADAHQQRGGFGETGEFVLGRREGDRIAFLLERRFPTADQSQTVRWSSELAEPMRLALSGERGWTIGQDYRGETVLAAYEPVDVLNLGLVAKSDLTEIRAPFVRAAAIAAIAAIVTILLGVAVSSRVTGPLLLRIEENEARIRTIVENAVEGIITIDERGRIESINSSAAKMFGFAKEEVIGRNIKLLMPEPYHSEHDTYIRDYRQTGRKRIIGTDRETVARRKDGSTFLAELAVSEVRLGDRQIFTGMIRDCTQRIRDREEKEHLIAELESKNAELERFTYSVSHDLKSPLVTIKGYLGLLKEDMTDGDASAVDEDLTRISSAADKMAQLLDELLELSRVGRLVNPPENVPLGDLAAEAVELVGGRLGSRGVEVVIHPDLPTVHGDRSRLVEVLQNLVDNAAKYMGDQPHPLIEIGGRVHMGEAICYVKDNGSGIEPRYREKIFELFQQLDQRADGSGVGLALVKRIVEVHGGRIWVESDGPTAGSTFWFALPTVAGGDESKGQEA